MNISRDMARQKSIEMIQVAPDVALTRIVNFLNELSAYPLGEQEFEVADLPRDRVLQDLRDKPIIEEELKWF